MYNGFNIPPGYREIDNDLFSIIIDELDNIPNIKSVRYLHYGNALDIEFKTSSDVRSITFDHDCIIVMYDRSGLKSFKIGYSEFVSVESILCSITTMLHV